MGRRGSRGNRKGRSAAKGGAGRESVPTVEPSVPAVPRRVGADNVLVKIRGLTFSYGERRVLSGVDIDMERGKVTAVLGPSGTGKTTLLKLISGQIRPDEGAVEMDGRNVHRLSHRELYGLRTRMGMLFQSGALLTDISVFDNVAYPLREHARLPESMIRKLVLMKLEAVGLRGARDFMPSQLSGGMARRVALARAAALDPMMILYDEPFTGQDPISRGVLMTLIRQLNDASGLTSILVSHDVEEAVGIADYVYIVADGRVISQGTPAEVASQRAPWVKQFMHGLPDGPAHFHFPALPLERDLLG